MDIKLNEDQIDKIAQRIVECWERDALPHAINQAVTERVKKRLDETDVIDDIVKVVAERLNEKKDHIAEAFSSCFEEAIGDSIAVISSSLAVSILERLFEDPAVGQRRKRRKT